jgi:hypothetical protein
MVSLLSISVKFIMELLIESAGSSLKKLARRVAPCREQEGLTILQPCEEFEKL